MSNSTWQEEERVGPSEGRRNKKWVVEVLKLPRTSLGPKDIVCCRESGRRRVCLTCWTEERGTSQVDFFSPLQGQTKSAHSLTDA